MYTRTYILRGTSWYQSVIPVPAGTCPLEIEYIPPPSSTNSKRIWTRAEVNGGANKGHPQTPSGSKSVALWWRSRDKAQGTHTDRGSNNWCVINPRCGPTFSECSHRHLHTGDHRITEGRRRLAPTSGSSLPQSEHLQKEDTSHHVSCCLHFDSSYSGGGQKHAYLVRSGPKAGAL